MGGQVSLIVDFAAVFLTVAYLCKLVLNGEQIVGYVRRHINRDFYVLKRSLHGQHVAVRKS